MRNRPLFLMLVLLFAFRSFAQESEGQPDTAATVITGTLKPAGSQSFSVITQKEKVEVRSVPANKVEALKQSEDYWYANLQPKEKEKQPVKPAPGWLRNLLWLIVLFGFIGVVIWYLASSNVSLFRKKPEKLVEEEEETSFDEDIFSLNYEKEIGKAVAAKNYRLAVRLWYLQTLKELSNRNLIVYSADKTNNDYVNALFNGPHYQEFFRLTRVFEYTWYGGFSISEEAYNLTQTEFQNFQNKLRQ